MPLLIDSVAFNIFLQSLTTNLPPFPDLSNSKDIVEEAIIYLIVILAGIKSNKITKILLFLASLLLSTRLLVSCGSCTVAPFPIVIGGSVSYTCLHQIDYHALTGRIVGVGYTNDTGMSTNIQVGSYTPIIAVYQGPLMTYLWGKSLAINDAYFGVTFSKDGTNIVAVTY